MSGPVHRLDQPGDSIRRFAELEGITILQTEEVLARCRALLGSQHPASEAAAPLPSHNPR
ncbi:MAG: hypothetical protein ABW203_00515 [Novosphingobium sp.]